MTLRSCSCAPPQLLRDSLLCGVCRGVAVPRDAPASILKAADAAAARLQTPSGTVPIEVIPDGGHQILDRSLLLANSDLFSAILPMGSSLTWLLKAAGSVVVHLAAHTVFDRIREWRRRKEDIKQVCLAVFGKYFALKDLPSLDRLAHGIVLARVFKDIIDKHTSAGPLDPEIQAICADDDDLFSPVLDEDPCSILLKATIQMVRSKVRASFGDLRGAYEDLQAVWSCSRCMDELESQLGPLAHLIILRQILNHSYLLSVDHQGHLNPTAFGYRTWLHETKARMDRLSPTPLEGDVPAAALDKWTPYGEIGPGLGLHFGNAALHARFEATAREDAKGILRARFKLAQAWEEATPSTTSWNQFTQIAGQALFLEDSALATEVLAYASARAGRADYPPVGRQMGMISPNPEATKMDAYALEWLLHMAMRDQAEGLIRPDMPEGEGSLADIRNRLIRLHQATRFRRISATVYCRVYPEATPEVKADAYFSNLGLGTEVFFPMAPRSLPKSS